MSASWLQGGAGVERQHTGDAQKDQRAPFQRDRDRVLYADRFRRLADVTQVVTPSESRLFHNRLTHTLEVAQIGRRLAEYLLDEYPKEVDAVGGIDPDVVEAGCLLHDLGHPPFGHIAEKELDRLVRGSLSGGFERLPGGYKGCDDGFEGNAQSFRIATQLSVHRIPYRGLDLTRRTLNAMLKYPWYRDLTGKDEKTKKWKKFGAYRVDGDTFEFARKGAPEGQLSVEAQIMDYADGVAYSVHDVLDFYRAGLIPLETIAYAPDAFEKFLTDWGNDPGAPQEPLQTIRNSDPEQYLRLLKLLSTNSTHQDPRAREAELKLQGSQLIAKYVRDVRLTEDPANALKIPDGGLAEQKLLQRLLWSHVIAEPELASVQEGQRHIIRELFKLFVAAIENEEPGLIPRTLRGFVGQCSAARLAADIVSSFSDREAQAIYGRFRGHDAGSVADILPF